MQIKGFKFWPIAWATLLILALTACAGGKQNRDGKPVSVAVWDLSALGPMAPAQAAMGELLSNQLASRFDQAQGFILVERSKLLQVMEELNIGSSDLADPNSRLRLGALVGAQQMVFGAYQIVGESMRMDVRLVDVATGKIVGIGVGTIDADQPANWGRAADQAADELLAKR